jgi:hypothetical protein
MHWRQLLKSLPMWAQFTGRSPGRVLSWACLAVILATTACGFQLTASSMVSARADYPLRSTRVLITGQDATTGDRMQVECVTTGDLGANNALLVELNDLSDVAAQVCIDYQPLAISRGSPYAVVK